MQQLNPVMIMVARESRGMTQAELARALGVSQTNLSRFERGSLGVSDEHVSQLSAVLKYPRGFFYQTDTIHPYGSNCLYHRKRVTVPAREFRTLTAKMNVLRMRIARLFRDTEIEASNSFHRMDIDDYDSASDVARLVRASWKLPIGPINNLTTAIESAGGIVIRYAFPTRRIDAFSEWPPDTPPIFFLNANAPMDRCRFTLAHEIGHVIMHQVPSASMEQEADAFAAEFLMPRQEIEGDLSQLTLHKLPILKSYWKVSMAALIRRARDIDTISEHQYRRLFTQLSKVGYRTTEPQPLTIEEPTIISQIIKLHRQEHGYSLKELAEMTHSDLDEFVREIAPEEHRPFRVVG